MEWALKCIDTAVEVISHVLTLLQPFAPYATAVAGLVAAGVAWRSLAQRKLADDRSEWWRRASNAIDLCARSDDQVGRNTGMTLLTHLLHDPTVTQSDAKMLQETVDTLIDEIVSQPATPASGTVATVGRRRSLRHPFAKGGTK